MLKIQRTTDRAAIVLTISGRLDAANVGQLCQLIDAEPTGEVVVLDLTDLILADRDVVRLLREFEARDAHCASQLSGVHPELDVSRGESLSPLSSWPAGKAVVARYRHLAKYKTSHAGHARGRRPPVPEHAAVVSCRRDMQPLDLVLTA